MYVRFGAISLLLFVSIWGSPADSAVIQVNTTGDSINMDTRCTLREAIIAANTDTLFMGCPAGSGDDIIELVLDGPYVMTVAGANEDGGITGDFDVRWHTTIRPASPTGKQTIDADDLDRAFEVFDAARLTLERINITNGNVVGFGGAIFSQHPQSEVELIRSEIYSNQATLFGGGIYSEGPLTLSRSSVDSNDAAFGGGIYMGTDALLLLTDSGLRGNDATADGAGINAINMIIESSTIEGNDAARFGGGLYWRNDTASDFSAVTNATIAENSALEHGGGLYVSSGGTVEIRSSTIAYNGCDTDENDNGDGCGLYVDSGNLILANTLVSYNEDLSSPGSIAPDCFGTVESAGYNLMSAIDSSDCVITGDTTGNQVGSVASPIDAQLDCLQDNGGSTNTYLPLDTSPVIDAAAPAGCFDAFGQVLAIDQRGHFRHWDGPDAGDDPRCDIGATEYGADEFNDIVMSDSFGDGAPKQVKGDGGCDPD
ncbi:MAG: hypothetical protein DHS20C11_19500 [Lysobacteraceae bacterium]|nr:MAG: hypothetical protein DHS20C11_19500 [Xanthomonadaceae bacterium]